MFDFTQWQAADPSQSRRSSVAPLPPPPDPPTQQPQPQPQLPTYVRRQSNPPQTYTLPAPAPRPIRGHDSPVLDVAQWCAPISELAEDAAMSESTSSEMEVEREVETTPPTHWPTPAPTRTHSAHMWATQACRHLASHPKPTSSPQRQPSRSNLPKSSMAHAALIPPSSCLDPA